MNESYASLQGLQITHKTTDEKTKIVKCFRINVLPLRGNHQIRCAEVVI